MLHANQLVATTAFMFGVDPAALLSRNRCARVAEARMALAWALRQNDWSLESIGDFLHRDHTTIMHALKTVQRKATHNARFAERLAALNRPTEPPIDHLARIAVLEAKVVELEMLLRERMA